MRTLPVAALLWACDRRSRDPVEGVDRHHPDPWSVPGPTPAHVATIGSAFVCEPHEPVLECAVEVPSDIVPGPIVTSAEVARSRVDGWGNGVRLGQTVVGLGDADGNGFGSFAADAYAAWTVNVYDVQADGAASEVATIRNEVLAAGSHLGTRMGVHPLGAGGTLALVTMSYSQIWIIPLPFAGPEVRVPRDATHHVEQGAMLPNLNGFSILDADGDGVPDLGVSYHNSSAPDGHEGGLEIVQGLRPGEYAIPDDSTIRISPQDVDPNSWGAPGVPDIDGDGLDDVLVAAPWYNHWGPPVLLSGGTGAVYVYTGLDAMSGYYGPGNERVMLVGTCDSQLDGDHRAVVGDVTGDGLPDVAESSYWFAPGDLYRAGGVFIISLPCLATASGIVDITTVSPAILVGGDGDVMYVPTGLGDLNADGVDDLAVGAFFGGCCGKVHIFLGPLSGVIDAAEADLTIEGTGEDQQFGWSLHGTGDLDGDGVPDLVVGAPASQWLNSWPDVGSVYFFSGADLLDAM